MCDNSRIAIIVPHYNDFERIYLCISSILKSFDGVDGYCLYIVDNGSSDVEKVEALKRYCEANIRLNFLFCSEPGSYRARNFALNSIGDAYDFVYFTDSDCIVNSDWKLLLDEIGRSCLNDRIYAGKVQIMDTGSRWSNSYEKVFAFPQEHYVHDLKFGVTANLLVPMEVFKNIGVFSVDSYSGGDKDFCNRAHASGVGITYDSRMMVLHPARASIKEILLKNIRTKKGHLIREKNRYGVALRMGLALARIIPRADTIYRRICERSFDGLSLAGCIRAVLVFISIHFVVSIYEGLYFFGVDFVDPR